MRTKSMLMVLILLLGLSISGCVSDEIQTVKCEPCDGTGRQICSNCIGSGKTISYKGTNDRRCSKCEGRGDLFCDPCDGSGRVEVVKR